MLKMAKVMPPKPLCESENSVREKICIERALRLIKSIPDRKKILEITSLAMTKRLDEQYDLVTCTDLIGQLPEKEHRLLFLEISRLMTRDGYAVISTALDNKTEGPLEKLFLLAETEFEILDCILSHHPYMFRNNPWMLRLSEKVCEFFYQEDGATHAILLVKRKSLF